MSMTDPALSQYVASAPTTSTYWSKPHEKAVCRYCDKPIGRRLDLVALHPRPWRHINPSVLRCDGTFSGEGTEATPRQYAPEDIDD